MQSCVILDGWQSLFLSPLPAFSEEFLLFLLLFCLPDIMCLQISHTKFSFIKSILKAQSLSAFSLPLLFLHRKFYVYLDLILLIFSWTFSNFSKQMKKKSCQQTKCCWILWLNIFSLFLKFSKGKLPNYNITWLKL